MGKRENTHTPLPITPLESNMDTFTEVKYEGGRGIHGTHTWVYLLPQHVLKG